jgi:hypothetical protein
MANFGVFIGFGFPVRGREKGAAKVFEELLQLLGKQSQAGAVESFEPCFLQAHGGDLGGFVLVRGDRAKLDQMVASQEFNRLATRAQLTVENFGIVNCWLGDEIQQQMATFMQAAGELA